MYVAADSSVVAPTVATATRGHMAASDALTPLCSANPSAQAGVTFQLREREAGRAVVTEAFSVEPQQAADDVLDRAFISEMAARCASK